jgi:hypothetical protein
MWTLGDKSRCNAGLGKSFPIGSQKSWMKCSLIPTADPNGAGSLTSTAHARTGRRTTQ